jgi:hypothetical protein
MPNITTVAGLRQEIQRLENKRSTQELLIKKRFDQTVETFNPVNILKSSLSGDFLSTAFALATGYLSKRILLGSTGQLLNKLLGNILQYGITALVIKKNQPDSAACQQGPVDE